MDKQADIPHQRTIQDLRDSITGIELTADELLSKREDAIFETRRRLEERVLRFKEGEEKVEWLVCAICGQQLRLSGNQFNHKFFKHFKDSNDCPIKTNSLLSKEEIDRIKYNKVQESQLHKDLKRYILSYLSIDDRFTNEKEEKRISSKSDSRNWRKPDISCNFIGKDLAIEIQLSSTYQETIIKREEFYKKENRYIIWIFDQFSKGGTLFTEKDIYYHNKKNAFVITDESKERSKEKGELILECQYQIPEITPEGVRDHWAKKYVSFSEITFNQDNFKVFFHDYDADLEHKLKAHRKLEFNQLKKASLGRLATNFAKRWLCYYEYDAECYRHRTACYHIANRMMQLLPCPNFDNPFENLPNDIQGTLNSLYSLKYRKMVGYNYSKQNIWVRMIINELVQRPQHAWLFARGIKRYGFYSEVKDRRSYLDKIAYINNGIKKRNSKFLQDKTYKPFFLALFPELD